MSLSDEDRLVALYGGGNDEPPAECDDDAHDWEYTRDLTLRECQVCGVQEHDGGGFEPPAPDKYGRPADPAYWCE